MDKKKKKIIFISVFAVGLATLIAGAVFLILNLTRSAGVADGEYLVSVEKWVLSDSDRVEWKFTEIGKGTLTTNAHENDYDFLWSLEDGKMKVETDWLYDLENEYDYRLDQNAGELILSADGEEHKFVAQQ